MKRENQFEPELLSNVCRQEEQGNRGNQGNLLAPHPVRLALSQLPELEVTQLLFIRGSMSE